MFFPGVPAAMSPKSRYSTLDQNSAARSTDLDSGSSELHQFIRKEGGKDEGYGRADPLCWNHYFLILVCAALAIALTAGGVGFHLGRESAGSSSTIRVEAKGSKFYLSLSRPSGAHGGPIKTRLYANDSFTKKPLSTETNAAWLSLFPLHIAGSGLIQHPELAPNVSGIAMFHELHCLNNVRTGYYHLLLDPQKNEPPEHSISRRNEERRPQKSDLDPGHVAHCFEYLRQTLICVADTNIEQIDPEAGGVTGWGVERRCGDYDEVVQWATTWKSKTVKALDHHLNDSNG